MDKGVWYKIVQPHSSRKPWFDGDGLLRKILTWALRIRSGPIQTNFIHLNNFINFIERRPTPLCDNCDKTEDIIHLLVEYQTIEQNTKQYRFIN